jgi:hypothetical protein
MITFNNKKYELEKLIVNQNSYTKHVILSFCICPDCRHFFGNIFIGVTGILFVISTIRTAKKVWFRFMYSQK